MSNEGLEKKAMTLIAEGGWRRRVLRDYLVPGLHSALLKDPTETDGSSVTMMIVPPEHGHVLPPEGIAPHNHGYDFEILVLSGLIVENRYGMACEWNFGPSSRPFCEYEYHHGRIHFLRQVYLTPMPGLNLMRGSMTRAKSSVIHDVVVPQQPHPVIWVRFETPRESFSTRLYLREPSRSQEIGSKAIPTDDAAVSAWLRMAGISTEVMA